MSNGMISQTVEQKIDQALLAMVATYGGVASVEIGEPPDDYTKKPRPAAWITTDELSSTPFAIGPLTRIVRSFEVKLAYTPDPNVPMDTQGETRLGLLVRALRAREGFIDHPDHGRLGALQITSRVKGEAVNSNGKIGAVQVGGEIRFVRHRDDPTRASAELVAVA